MAAFCAATDPENAIVIAMSAAKDDPCEMDKIERWAEVRPSRMRHPLLAD
jgi:hypothetical protein